MHKLIKKGINLSLFVCGIILILNASYWFRIPSQDDNNIQQKRPRVYNKIIIFFFDATGYRYVENEQEEPIFHTITALQDLIRQNPDKTFLSKTFAIPPSTDFTILSIINGVVQMSNYLDVIFKTSPQTYEASFTKKPIKSALFSSKKADWFKMSSGQFTYVENPQRFQLQNIQSADHSSFNFFQEAYNKKEYDFLVQHFMGYDALGHALQYQNFEKGIELMKMYNHALEWMIQHLEEDELLIVVGDHDQSYRGKHYQCSVESRECEGFMFAYHKGGLFKREHKPDHYEPADISATIHALFGFDTSNQNMGKLLPEFYPAYIDQSRIQQDQEMVRDRMVWHLQNQGKQISQHFIQDTFDLDSVQAQETMQANFRFGKPDKFKYFLGLFCILGSILLLQYGKKTLRLKDFGYIIILVIGQIISSFLYLIILINESKDKLSNHKEIIKLSTLSFILLFPKIVTFIPIELLFLCLLVVKYQFLAQSVKFQLTYKVTIVLFMALFSQILVYVFFSFDRILYDERRFIAMILVINLAIFIFVDPRLFNKDKIKVLYILILYLIADISVIFQLNPEFNFIQFILLFGMMDLFNGFYNIVLAKFILMNINPMMIQHSYFRNQTQINMNSLIILVHDFQVGPSLISIFFGFYGILLIAQFTQMLKKTNQNLIVISQYCYIIYISYILLTFRHQIGQSVEREVFVLYKLPIYLMELLIFFICELLI